MIKCRIERVGDLRFPNVWGVLVFETFEIIDYVNLVKYYSEKKSGFSNIKVTKCIFHFKI